MRHAKFAGAALCVGILLAAGCSGNQPRKADLTSAIDNYYSANPDCIFPDPVQLPAKVDNSDSQEIQQYDALAGAGLLKKTAEEPKPVAKTERRHSGRGRASKAEQHEATPAATSYDLSDNGRLSWTADPTRPGYGNFCYGHRHVTSIDSMAAAKNQQGQHTAVALYHYDITEAPAWANNDEVKAAFPKMTATLSGSQAAKANLVKEQAGWKVQPPAPGEEIPGEMPAETQ